MSPTKRPQGRALRGTGERRGQHSRDTARGAGSRTYLARGRLGFLTVSEGGRLLTIMVGPLRGPEQLDLIHRERFYHVPVSAIAASRISIAYIAFYEGASRFRGQAGAIREYAAVLRVARVPRRDLPGLTWPGRQGEDIPYYRFDLGPILQLPRPITNPERLRVAFRFPELEQLHGAATIRDLGKSGRPAPSRRKAQCRPTARPTQGGRDE